MKRIVLCFVGVMILLFIEGCGTMVTSNLQRMTATKLNVHPDSVTVKDVDLGVTVKKWVAIVKGVEYDCFADMNFENTHCILLKGVSQNPENGKKIKKQRPQQK